MRNRVLTVLVSLMAWGSLALNAQTSLAGRTYHNPNILADMMNDVTKDLDKKVAEAKAQGVAKFEKKKGRKPTAAEMEELEKTIKEKMEQVEVMKKGMKMAVTVEFKDDKNLVMTQKTKISDEALKMAGYGWVKRKALKAALAVAPSSEKGTYVAKGNIVIMTSSDNEKDTMTISQDGKILMGKLDKKTKFKLTRTK